MDKKTVFVKTDTGESEASGHSDALYGDSKRILMLVDDESTVGEISKRAPPSLRETLNNVLQELVDGGYIRDMRAPVNVAPKSTLKISTPALKMAVPKAAPAPFTPPPSAPPVMQKPVPQKPVTKPIEPAKFDGDSDLDFSFITSSTDNKKEQAVGAVEKAAAEALAKKEAERLKAEQAAQIEATAKAVKLKAYEEAKERAKKEVAAKAAQQKAEEEAKTRAELAATQARVEAEARTRIEAEVKGKQEAEAARLKAEKEAEKIRLELAAAKAKAEEEMRNRLEAEARAKSEEEARKKREAEAERLRVEKQRAELEIARIKAEAELKMREEAELRVRAEVEARVQAEAAERAKREAEAERLRIEKERAELEIARLRAVTEQKMREESEIRIRAELDARQKAEELAKQSALSKVRQDGGSGTGANQILAEEEQIDPADKLRQSFINSFAHSKDKNKSSADSFKLDTFSFDVPSQKPDATVPPKKVEVPPAGVSKVKQAVEQKALKAAEEQRLKAEQEAARLKAEQEQAARHKAEQDAARLKAEHEAYRLKAAQEEGRIKAEAEAQKLADQQAKQWEEAQQRAANQAQMEKERLAKQSAEAQEKPKQKKSRSPRKSLPVGKIVAGLFTLMLLAVAFLPYIWPLDEYISPLEQEISAQLKQPVKIQKISLVLLPMPKLELHSVSVGSGQELSIGDAVLNFDFSALFAPTKSIGSMALNNVTVSASSLDKAVLWLQAAGGNEKYPVARMEFKSIRLKTDEIKLPLFSGNAKFDAQGNFTEAELKSEDDKYSIVLQSQQSRLQLELSVHENSLPILTNYKFKDFSVSGTINNGEFVFSDLFAHIHGGTITGKGKLGWFNGWKFDGLLNAKSLELQSMFPNFGVTGEVYGDVNVFMYGTALSQLDKAPRMDGTFEAKNGTVNKLDIETTARFGSRQGGGGRFNFNELSGNLSADNLSQRFNLNKISAGVVSGSGAFEVDVNQKLSGKLLVDIKGMANGKIPMLLSGSPADPQLQTGR